MRKQDPHSIGSGARVLKGRSARIQKERRSGSGPLRTSSAARRAACRRRACPACHMRKVPRGEKGREEERRQEKRAGGVRVSCSGVKRAFQPRATHTAAAPPTSSARRRPPLWRAACTGAQTGPLSRAAGAARCSLAAMAEAMHVEAPGRCISRHPSSEKEKSWCPPYPGVYFYFMGSAVEALDGASTAALRVGDSSAALADRRRLTSGTTAGNVAHVNAHARECSSAAHALLSRLASKGDAQWNDAQ